MLTARYVLHSTFCSHSVFMCFVWIWEQTAIISLYSIDWLVFVTETECVNCAVHEFCVHLGTRIFKATWRHGHVTIIYVLSEGTWPFRRTLWFFLFGNPGFSPRSKGQLSWHVLWFSSVPPSKCVDRNQIRPAALCNLHCWRQAGSSSRLYPKRCQVVVDLNVREFLLQGFRPSVIACFNIKFFNFRDCFWRNGVKRRGWHVGLPTVLLLPSISVSHSFPVCGAPRPNKIRSTSRD